MRRETQLSHCPLAHTQILSADGWTYQSVLLHTLGIKKMCFI
ncbi:unnamed protein product [Brassica oleracea]|uniref:Uncharacterized protein n=1 Tax=Brassica oleracea TaxID=3712 RepID=A0A3P6H3C1_BRAOL|nr:unnamed protein product [Brassica oleracea]